MRTLSAILLTTLAAAAGPVPSERSESRGLHDAEIASLRERLADAAKTYDAGDAAGASEKAVDAFLAFEESSFHSALAAKDHGLYKALELDWLDVVKAYEGRDARAKEKAAALAARLDAAEALFREKADPKSTAVGAFFILFREGFEALLILGAIAATLRKLGRSEMGRVLWGGAVAAVGASFGLFFLSQSLIRISGAGQEVLEGATMLVAAGVLFWMSYWLISKIEGRKWQTFIQENVKKALSRSNAFGIGALAFLVVFREGFETVLMIRALQAGGAGWGPVLGGMGVAAIALAGVFVAIIVAGKRVPIRAFFAVTSAVLLALVFKFAGDGVLELQEGMVLGRHPVSWLPSSGFLSTWLGIHPSVEGLVLQAAVIAAIAGGLAWTFLRREAPPGSAKPAPKREPVEVA